MVDGISLLTKPWIPAVINGFDYALVLLFKVEGDIKQFRRTPYFS